jgi:hypothetical protein
MSNERPLPIMIGSTENSLRALLSKILSTSRIRTYPAWVVLNAASRSETASKDWRSDVADALKVELEIVDNLIDQLADAGLVGDGGLPTSFGMSELAKGRSAVSAATSRLIDGISHEAQTTVRQVLDQVRRRADEMLQQ